GCPPFKSKDSVVNRPDGDPAHPTTVAPGEHVFRTADRGPRTAHRVVWWDPSLLHLNAVSSFGLRRDDLIVKDGDMFAVEDRLAEYEKWRAEREQTIDAGKREAMRVLTATAWAADAARDGVDEAIA